MRDNALHASDDPEVVRRLIKDHPWGVLVSDSGTGLVASHYPILLDDDYDGLAVLTHVGRPDETNHRFRDHEVLLIIQGNHGYVSPSWYAPGATKAPTWNFSVAHCYGVPEVLDEDENLEVLGRLVATFERHVEDPVFLDPEWGRPLSRRTVGLRVPISRFVCKIKLSQDKDEQTQRQVVEALKAPGPYQHPALAAEMERALFRT